VNATLTPLQQHLAREAREMRAFIELLDEEARALQVQDAGAALADTTTRKHAYAERMGALAQTRAVLFHDLGFADVGSDLAPIVQKYPALRPAIDTLIALAAQARAKNQENGVIIQTIQRHHQETLNALQALAGAGKHRLYDARGRNLPAGRRASARAQAYVA